MSTRHYCDRCEREMTEAELGSLHVEEFSHGRIFKVKADHIVFPPDPTHLCHACIREMLAPKTG